MYLVHSTAVTDPPRGGAPSQATRKALLHALDAVKRKLLNDAYSRLAKRAAKRSPWATLEELGWEEEPGELKYPDTTVGRLQRFELGRATYESRPNREHFLDDTAIGFLKKQGISLVVPGRESGSESWAGADGESWKSFDEHLVDCWNRNVQELKVKLRREDSFFKRNTIAGSFVLQREFGSVADFSAIFVPKATPAEAVKNGMISGLNAVLKDQRKRNELADEYLDLPRAKPMSRELFLSLMECMDAVEPALISVIEENIDGLIPLMGGRRPIEETIYLGLRRGDHRRISDSPNMSLELYRCEHCGAPIAIDKLRGYSSAGRRWKPFEYSSKALNELLSAAHDEDACDAALELDSRYYESLGYAEDDCDCDFDLDFGDED